MEAWKFLIRNAIPMFFVSVIIAVNLIPMTSTMELNVSEFLDSAWDKFDKGTGFSAFQTFIRKNSQVVEHPIDGKKSLNLLRQSINLVVERTAQAARKLAEYLSLSSHWTKTPTFAHCTNLTGANLTMNFDLNVMVDTNQACQIPTAGDDGIRYPTADILDVFRQNSYLLSESGTSQVQYLTTESGLMVTYPAVQWPPESLQDYDPRIRPFYVHGYNQFHKDIAIVIDTGVGIGEKFSGIFTKAQAAGQAVVKIALSLISKDRIFISPTTVDAFSELSYESCLFEALTPVSNNLKNLISKHLPKFTNSSNSNRMFADAVSAAFSRLKKGPATHTRHTAVSIFVGSEIADLDRTVTIIQEATKSFNETSVPYLFLYQLGKDTEVTIQLQSILNQYPRHAFFSFLETVNDINQVPRFYNFFEPKNQDTIRITPPYGDIISNTGIVTLNLPVISKASNVLYGIISIDSSLNQILADAISFNAGRNGYTFVVDLEDSTALLHPLIPLPRERGNRSELVLISLLEHSSSKDELKLLLDDLMAAQAGQRELITYRFIPKGHPHQQGVVKKEVRSVYYYTPITARGLKWELCIVLEKGSGIKFSRFLEKSKQKLGFKVRFTYHRYDLLSGSSIPVCGNFLHRSTKGVSTVKLAPKCFQNASKYLYNFESKTTVENYQKAVRRQSVDETFSEGVVEDIELTGVLEKWYKVGNLSNRFVTYPTWRVFCSPRGVFRIYPGAILRSQKMYDCSSRPVYLITAGHNPSLVMQPPEKGTLGEGLIVKWAKVVLEKETRDLFGVLSMETPLVFLHRLIINSLNVCVSADASCMIIDSSGFVISHASWLTPTWSEVPRIQGVHISDIEPKLANILLSRGYMIRASCFDMFTLQQKTFFQVTFDSIDDGEGFSGKQLTGTNLFLIVKESEELIEQESKRCNCLWQPCLFYRTDCLCPCVISASFDRCSNTFDSENWIPCTAVGLQSDPFIKSATFSFIDFKTDDLDFCHPNNCDNSTEDKCHPQSVCRWCAYNRSGIELEEPFCAVYNICYYGQFNRTAKEYYSMFFPPPPEISSNGGGLSFDEIVFPYGVLALSLLLLTITVAGITYACKRKGVYVTKTNSQELNAMPSIQVTNVRGDTRLVFSPDTKLYTSTTGTTLSETSGKESPPIKNLLPVAEEQIRFLDGIPFEAYSEEERAKILKGLKTSISQIAGTTKAEENKHAHEETDRKKHHEHKKKPHPSEQSTPSDSAAGSSASDSDTLLSSDLPSETASETTIQTQGSPVDPEIYLNKQ